MKHLRAHPLPILLMVLTGLVLLLGACTPTPGPACTFEELIAPTNLLPNDTTTTPGDTPVLNTLTPTFTWDYTGGCTPDSYNLQISRPWWEHASDGITAPAVEATSWTPGTPLLPGSMYSWYIAAQVDSNLGPHSEWAVFLTGPLCMDPFASEYPAPVLLGPDDGYVVTTRNDIHFSDDSTAPSVSFPMVWDDPAECLPEDGYNLLVSDLSTFPDDPVHTLEFGQDYRTVAQFFFPPGFAWSECSTWYWKVQADLPGSTEGPWSETRSFTVNTTGADCTAVPTPTATIGVDLPFADVIQDGACRSGPTLDHQVLDYVLSGESFRIEGKNLEGTWWWIFDERIQRSCWVSGKLVGTRGPTEDLAIITPIPAEVEGPTGTPEVGCWVNGANQQPVCVAPCPPNTYPPIVYCRP